MKAYILFANIRFLSIRKIEYSFAIKLLPCGNPTSLLGPLVHGSGTGALKDWDNATKRWGCWGWWWGQVGQSWRD